MKGYIKKVRPDNKIDVRLQKSGFINVRSNEENILSRLQENKGYLKIGDHSAPEEVYALLGISKKTFKKVIGTHYKKRLIRIEEDGIYLN